MKRAIAIGLVLSTVIITSILMHDKDNTVYLNVHCPLRPEIGVSSNRVVIVNNECTGFILGDGYVATAHHCMEPRDKFVIGDKEEITFYDNTKEVFEIVAIGDADSKDYAVLKGNTHSIPPVPVSFLEPLPDSVMRVIGYGGGVNGLNTLHMSIGAYIRTTEGGYMESAVIILPGDSGGPLLDEDGSVIGINVRTGYPIPIGLSIKAFYAVQAMEDYKKAQGK